ncbi:hypothetical protein ABAC460_17470 [Asticcacaulis sp. AC460]|nr:hypothetical protein ABAC460_17470 [Asticcacaulis sp. AC460]
MSCYSLAVISECAAKADAVALGEAQNPRRLVDRGGRIVRQSMGRPGPEDYGCRNRRQDGRLGVGYSSGIGFIEMVVMVLVRTARLVRQSLHIDMTRASINIAIARG